MDRSQEIRVPSSLPRIAADVAVGILISIALISFALGSSASETPLRAIDAPAEALENLHEDRAYGEPWNSGWPFNIDNDYLSPLTRDRALLIYDFDLDYASLTAIE